MGYTDGGMREFRLAEAATLKTGSNHGTFQPSYQPVVIRACVAQVTTTIASNDAGFFNAVFTKRDRVTGSNIATVATVRLSAGNAVGKIVYKDQLDVKVSPSEDIVVASSGIGDGAASFYIVYEPSPETPANNTDMVESA